MSRSSGAKNKPQGSHPVLSPSCNDIKQTPTQFHGDLLMSFQQRPCSKSGLRLHRGPSKKGRRYEAKLIQRGNHGIEDLSSCIFPVNIAQKGEIPKLLQKRWTTKVHCDKRFTTEICRKIDIQLETCIYYVIWM